MAGELNIDQSTIKTEASNILSTAEHFTATSLLSYDGTSTIHANKASQATFRGGQQLKASFGVAMDQEAVNIQSLGASFAEFDQKMNMLNQQGL